jgi:hypothetical protein
MVLEGFKIGQKGNLYLIKQLKYKTIIVYGAFSSFPKGEDLIFY